MASGRVIRWVVVLDEGEGGAGAVEGDECAVDEVVG